ncbi:MAG: MogA/MoaB family molybdenum cofactor biosynthesis protein [Chloroflexota bacterium]|nr:MogA/MoaB family molybdenum cofactor biosynthesis protein [Chloroflexota bacterium]
MRTKLQLKFGILTVSDRSSRGERPDASGPALKEKILQQGWKIPRQGIVPDELLPLKDTLSQWADTERLDVILTTGGTGFSPRDITPEATQAVLHRPVPGLAEAMRAASLKITPHAMLSRAIAGIRGRTLIINLPGSPTAAIENLEVVLPVLNHAVQLLREDPKAEADHSFA